MKKTILVLALLASGCTSTGMLTPQASALVNQSIASICPVATTTQVFEAATTKDALAAINLLNSVCPPNPPPTNATVALVDILAAYDTLKPLIKK